MFPIVQVIVYDVPANIKFTVKLLIAMVAHIGFHGKGTFTVKLARSNVQLFIL